MAETSAPTPRRRARARPAKILIGLLAVAAVLASAATIARMVDARPTLPAALGPEHSGEPPIWSGALGRVRPGARPPFAGWLSTPWNVYGGGRVDIVSDPTRGSVLRSYGAPNQGGQNQRAEQVPALKEPGRGETIWIGFDLRVNGSLGVSPLWQSVFQFKTNGRQDQTSPVGIQVAGRGRNDVFLSNGNGRRLYSLGPVPRNTWTRLVIAIHIETKPGAGWVAAYRDGRLVRPRVPWTSTNADGTVGSTQYPGGRGSYLKFGLYRGPAPFPADIRFARIAVGTSPESVHR